MYLRLMFCAISTQAQVFIHKSLVHKIHSCITTKLTVKTSFHDSYLSILSVVLNKVEMSFISLLTSICYHYCKCRCLTHHGLVSLCEF